MKEITCEHGLSAYIDKTVIIKSKRNPKGEKWIIKMFKGWKIGFQHTTRKNEMMSFEYARQCGYHIFFE